MEKTSVHRHVSRKRADAVRAVDAGTATFDQWFIAQFGEDPFPGADLAELRTALRDAELRAAQLLLDVREAERRLALRDAALKAWTAREDLIRRNLET